MDDDLTGTTERPDVAGRLRELGAGHVLTPDDPGFAAASAVRYGPARRPLAVVRAMSTDDVRAVVSFARRTGHPLAVRSGGHSAAGHGTVDRGVVLDVRGLTGLEVDPGARVARAGGGLTAGQVTAATGTHGLAVGFGDTGSVGIAGITLGGGVGLLSRKHGLTVDSLVGAEVVTADGTVHQVDAEHEPELFWALRGGGGNFGVVTRFDLALHDVTQFVGGLLVLPATPEVVAGVVAVASEAPRELSAITHVMVCPPMPFVPAGWHGRPVVLTTVGWCGDVTAGTRVVDRLRALAEPVVDTVAACTYASLFAGEDDHGPGPQGGPAPVPFARTSFVDGVDLAAAARAVTWVGSSPGPVRVVQLRALGGAIDDVPTDATAYAHRGSPLMLNVASMYTDPADRDDVEREVLRTSDALGTGRPGAYVNFVGDEGEERVRAAYPGATWDRLARTKARYDPGNLFRGNQNVAPA